MRKLLAIFLLTLVIIEIRFNTVEVLASERVNECIAFVEPDSGALGSTFNYFFAVPYVQYYDNDGVCTGKMFSAVVFGMSAPLATPAQAESFIGQIMQENQNIHVVNTSVGALKEAGFAEKDYMFSIYVEMPQVSKMFDTDEERMEFCEYYINSLSAVFDRCGFEHTALTGMYFDEEFCSDTALAEKCNDICEKYNLAVLAYGDMSHLNIAGVPKENDNNISVALRNDYDSYLKSGANKPIGFHFDSYGTLHECAVALSELPGNPAARAVFDDIHGIIEGTIGDSVSVQTEIKGRVASGVEYAAYAFIASLGAACGVYLLVKCLRKAFAK